MADVKWIKIVVDIFDDEKIFLIEQLPEADSIIVIWFKLLCLAGKQNNKGVFTLCETMPYTDEMFSAVFRRPLNTVRLALNTFQKFGMVEIVNGTVTIPNWGKHQNIEGMEKRREYMSGYMKEYRQEQKALADGKRSRKHLRKQDVSDTDIEIEIERDIEGDKKDIYTKHRYGEYQNVLLTDTDLEKLKAEIPGWEAMIDRLSGYMKSTGKVYKDHLATMRNWNRRDNGTNRVGSDNDRAGAGPYAGDGSVSEYANLPAIRC